MRKEIGRGSLAFVDGQWHARIAPRGQVGTRHVVPLGEDLGRRQKRAAAERADKIRMAIKSPALFASDKECNAWLAMMRWEIGQNIWAAADVARTLHEFTKYDDVDALQNLLSVVGSASSVWRTRCDTHEERVGRAERMRVLLVAAGKGVAPNPSAVAIGALGALDRAKTPWTFDLGAVFSQAGMKPAKERGRAT